MSYMSRATSGNGQGASQDSGELLLMFGSVSYLLGQLEQIAVLQFSVHKIEMILFQDLAEVVFGNILNF